MEEKILRVVLEVLNGGADPREFNDTFICLIPKAKKPKHTKEFRPTSLYNVIMKVITRTIANRLKLILPQVVGEYQSDFVLGRLITDNDRIAFKNFHFMRKTTKGKIGYMGVKLDMAKAYDRVEL